MGELIRRPATITAKNALLWGLFWLLGGAILGWYFSIVPTSIVDYTWGRTALINYVIYGVVIWVALALPTLLVMWFAKGGVAVWEVFGRMLFAHLPITFVMLPAMFGDKVAYSTFMSSPLSPQLSIIYTLLMSIYVVALVAWFFYWSYITFRKITQLKGWLGVLIFSVAIQCSYWMSEYVIKELMKM
jgi:hypothetical protein